MEIPRFLRRARIRWAGHGRMAAGLVALGAVLAAVLPAAVISAGPASAGAAAGNMLCRRYQHISVQGVQPAVNGLTGTASRYMVRNDFWGSNGMCMMNAGKQPNFRVARAGRNQLGGAVMAFPYIFAGCSWGICTPKSGLPARAGTLRNPTSSWYIRARAGGTWDASYDLWFSRHKMINGQATGAELMIWLRASHMPVSRTVHPLSIDGAKWYFVTWMTPRRGGFSWRYIQFRRVHPTSHVQNLNLGAFIRRAEHIRVPSAHGSVPLIRPRWWLMNIEAGFELIHGGQGLATNHFSAHL
jgi:hypothetical protein